MEKEEILIIEHEREIRKLKHQFNEDEISSETLMTNKALHEISINTLKKELEDK